MTSDRKARFRQLLQTDVWQDIKAESEDIIGECREYVDHALLNAPEKLTTKTAIAKGNRAKGIRDLIDTIEGAAK